MKVLFQELNGKNIMTGWDWCMGGENGGCLYLPQGISEGYAFLHLLPDTLQHHEGGVTFVGVPNRRLDAKRSQDAYSTDA